MQIFAKPLCVLSGAAGTGKTTVIRAILENIDRVHGAGTSFLLMAPTGKASERIKNQTGKKSSTIHSHLAKCGWINENFTLKRIGGATSEDVNTIIIDECSMIGVNLLGLLFQYVNKNTKIVLICDEAQLASISCGNIVQDIIDSNIVPTVKLNKVFRYGIGGIATVATDIRNGKELKEENKYQDYQFVPISNNPLNDILSIYNNELKKYNPEEIMILSPFNVRETGTYAINAEIQKKYNQNESFMSYKKQGFDIEFKIGDRIVNTENNYHMESDYGEVAIMNGDIGKIVNYDGNFIEVHFDNANVYLEKNDMFKMLLANAISIHKSQGNQAKCVIVVMDSSHGFFLNRNIEYVAVSRAQEKLIVIGDLNTINSSMKIQQEKNRETNLKMMLSN